MAWKLVISGIMYVHDAYTILEIFKKHLQLNCFFLIYFIVSDSYSKIVRGWRSMFIGSDR